MLPDPDVAIIMFFLRKEKKILYLNTASLCATRKCRVASLVVLWLD